MRDLYIQSDHGECVGYIAQTSNDSFGKWLELEAGEVASGLHEKIRELAGSVFVLGSIEIFSEFQGNGLGSELLKDSIAQADAELVILVADQTEGQQEGFDLTRFYENHGFRQILNHEGFPMMVYPALMADKLLQSEIDKVKQPSCVALPGF